MLDNNFEIQVSILNGIETMTEYFYFRSSENRATFNFTNI